mmetsp:Transcript_13213/g.31272  ORF Transcript_13213/g.31272 Transcript_13213/m.31272 type:complete len:296 (-) Transcript_13213:533-1420(-)
MHVLHEAKPGSASRAHDAWPLHDLLPSAAQAASAVSPRSFSHAGCARAAWPASLLASRGGAGCRVNPPELLEGFDRGVRLSGERVAVLGRLPRYRADRLGRGGAQPLRAHVVRDAHVADSDVHLGGFALPEGAEPEERAAVRLLLRRGLGLCGLLPGDHPGEARRVLDLGLRRLRKQLALRQRLLLLPRLLRLLALLPLALVLLPLPDRLRGPPLRGLAKRPRLRRLRGLLRRPRRGRRPPRPRRGGRCCPRRPPLQARRLERGPLLLLGLHLNLGLVLLFLLVAEITVCDVFFF